MQPHRRATHVVLRPVHPKRVGTGAGGLHDIRGTAGVPRHKVSHVVHRIPDRDPHPPAAPRPAVTLANLFICEQRPLLATSGSSGRRRHLRRGSGRRNTAVWAVGAVRCLGCGASTAAPTGDATA